MTQKTKCASTVTIRQLGVGDKDEALAWRMEVLEDVFEQDGPWPRDELRTANANFLRSHLGSDLVYCVASIDGEDVGCGAICFQEELPSPDNPTAKSAYLMNIYTRKEAREHGIGHAIVSWLIALAEEAGAGKIYLEATDAGSSVYEGLGFRSMDGMMKLSVDDAVRGE